jgi:death-on-curing family protein
MKAITVADVENISFRLAKELLSAEEPIPDFGTRYPGRLESCMVTPFMRFSGRALYPTLIDKAAILFYLMIKNHPFVNGNKRIAVTTLLTFLHRNKKWLEADDEEFYNITVWVATSLPESKDEVVAALRKFVRNRLTDL